LNNFIFIFFFFSEVDPDEPKEKTTKAAITTSKSTALTTAKDKLTDSKNKFCTQNYRKPLHHNPNKTKLDLIENEDDENSYMPRSKITFECLPGYTIYKEDLGLTTTCQPDGTWSPVSDCNKFLYI
jgi:hypothetical protein